MIDILIFNKQDEPYIMSCWLATADLTPISHLCACSVIIYNQDLTSIDWIDGWMDAWMDEWMDGWMEGWMDFYSPFSHSNKYCKNINFNIKWKWTDVREAINIVYQADRSDVHNKQHIAQKKRLKSWTKTIFTNISSKHSVEAKFVLGGLHQCLNIAACAILTHMLTFPNVFSIQTFSLSQIYCFQYAL